MNAHEITGEDFDELVAVAEDTLSAGDWAAAAARYEDLVRARPGQVDLKYKLAQAYEELGRLQDAIDLLSDPTVARLGKSKRRLAKFYIAAGDYEAATPLVDELLAKTPDSPKFAAWKAICEGKSADDPRVAKRIEQAQELASTDRLKEAEQAYVQLLNDYPAVARPYLHLGQIYAQQKRWAESIATFTAGLALEPANNKLTFSLARSLLKDGQPAQAVDLLNKAEGLRTDPDAQFLLQRCYMQLREWDRVEDIAKHLLASLPTDDPFRDPVSRIREDAIVERESVNIEALRGTIGLDAAIVAYRDLTKRFPASPVAWLKLGIALADADQDAEAGTALRHALELDSEEMEIRRAFSRLVIKTAEEQDVLRYVNDAIAADGADFECLRWLARYQADRNDWSASLDSARRAMAMDPHHASARVLVVRALMGLGRFPEALDELEILISTGAKRVETLQLKADIFARQGRIQDAIRLYREALEDSPKHPLISHRLSCALLSNGDIAGFHRFHEKRRDRESFIENERQRPFEPWNGQLSIQGKLLVWTEAGFSIAQNILCMEFIGPLARLGFDIVLEVDPLLLGLCQRSFPNVTVIAQGDELPGQISHHTPAGSLSRWFKHDLDSFSTVRPFLVADAGAACAHRERLKKAAGDGQLLVGVTGMASDEDRLDKDLPRLDQLLDVIAAPGVTFVDLQDRHLPPEHADEGKRLIGSGLTDRDDLDALSAVVAAMDLVVGTDGVAAHIAGAVGTPTFVLLPPVPAAYWLARGEQSIFYPATKLFRRSSIDADWSEVLAKVGRALGDFAGRYSTSSWHAQRAFQGSQSDRSAVSSAAEIADAIPAFLAQGPFAPGAYRSALELIDRLPADHQSKELRVQRAQLLARLGYWEEARSAYAALQSGDEDDSEIAKGILSVSLAMYDLDEALILARKLARAAPAYHLTAANILYRTRRYDPALAELREAVVENPGLPGLGTLFGTILLERNEAARAEAYLANYAALTRRPEDYTLLGLSLSAQGRHAEALEVFDKALSIAPEDPAASFWRTQARIQLDQAAHIPLPPLAGERPDVARDDIVVFFAADSAFFWEHGLVLLGSIAQQSPNAKCHVHVINPDVGVAGAIETARALLPGLGLSYSFEEVDLEGRSEAHVRTYYASVRFVRLAEIFAAAPASYLCLDADCIVRGDIGSAFGGESADVRMRLRYDERPHVTVAAGALALSPTAGASRFIDQVSALVRAVLEAGEGAWFLDQIVLGHLHRKLAPAEVQVKLLDSTYLDWFFHDQSLIWTGKGPRKFEDEKYTSELARYRYLQENKHIAELMRASTNDCRET